MALFWPARWGEAPSHRGLLQQEETDSIGDMVVGLETICLEAKAGQCGGQVTGLGKSLFLRARDSRDDKQGTSAGILRGALWRLGTGSQEADADAGWVLTWPVLNSYLLSTSVY